MSGRGKSSQKPRGATAPVKQNAAPGNAKNTNPPIVAGDAPTPEAYDADDEDVTADDQLSGRGMGGIDPDSAHDDKLRVTPKVSRSEP